MNRLKSLSLYILSLMTITLSWSCTDTETFSTSPSYRLTFSDDTVSFDTVLSNICSSTRRVLVFNSNKDGIRINNVYLGSGGTSGFRINVDGRTGPNVDNLEIFKGDSIFVFIDVTSEQNGNNSPVEKRDSIIFNLENGVQQMMQLIAYGQDVIVMKAVEVRQGETLTLTSDKPYLIYDSLKVDTDAVLNIEAGATLYFHDNTSILVDGTLNIRGEEGRYATLRSDRTDRMFSYLPYDRLDTYWGGIRLRASSTDNTINYADIHGGKYGIICDSTGTGKVKVTITNSILHNVSGYGFYSYGNRIIIGNTQISNAGKNCVYLIGGDNTLDFCTIAQFYARSGNRGYALVLGNHDDSENNWHSPCPLTQSYISNTVINGYGSDEIRLQVYNYKYKKGEKIAYEALFSHCFLNTDTVGCGEYFNDDCIFDSKDNDKYRADNFKCVDSHNFLYDFHLDSASIAFDKEIGIKW